MKIEGLDKTLAAMVEFKDDIKGNPLRRSLRAAMGPVLDEARRLAPEDTGRLKRNIISKPVPAKSLGTKFTDGQEVMARGTTRAGASKDDPNNAWYWRFIEFGTKHITRQPFLRPALDAKRSDAFAVFQGRMRQEVERAAKRARDKNK